MIFEGIAGGRKTVSYTFIDQAGATIDITNDAPELTFGLNGAAKVSKAMTITDGPNGVAKYTFTAAEQLVAGSIELYTQRTVGGELKKQIKKDYFRISAA